MKPAGLLFACWIAGTCVALWQYSVRYARAVEPPSGWTRLDPSRAPASPVESLATDRGGFQLAGEGSVRVVNFWDPDCACSRFQSPSIREAMRRWPRVRWVTVVPGGAELAARAAREFPGVPVAADPQGRIARRFGVPAAPAAAVIDARGRTVYVGAYNIGRFCDAQETAYAAQAISAALRGEPPKVASTPFFGCGSPASVAERARPGDEGRPPASREDARSHERELR